MFLVSIAVLVVYWQLYVVRHLCVCSHTGTSTNKPFSLLLDESGKCGLALQSFDLLTRHVCPLRFSAMYDGYFRKLLGVLQQFPLQLRYRLAIRILLSNF